MRANVPGALGHAGDVDEFDAAIVRGARPDGPLLGDSDLPEAPDPAAVSLPAAPGGDERGAPQYEPGPGAPEGDEPSARSAVVRAPGSAAAPRQRGANRALAFLRASWAELQRVQWPDRRQVAQATAVVLGFVAVAGAYLGAADWLAQKVVDFIL